MNLQEFARGDAHEACRKVYALVGLNGIGKSTFLNSITGQTSLLSGKLFLNQQELQKISKVNLPKLIAYVDSSFAGVEYLTVFDYLALGRSPHTNNMGKLNKEDKQVEKKIIFLKLISFKNLL